MIEIFILALAVSMDALAVSISIGMYKCSECQDNIRLKVASTFGFFQAFMTIAGFYLAFSFRSHIENIDHWVALILLSYIGFNMLKAAYKNEVDDFDPTSNSALLINGVATSIDALIIGVTLATLNKDVFSNAIVIGLATFILSYLGVKLGVKLGAKLSRYALVVGGLVLIAIGVKTFIEHTFFV